MRDSPTLLPWLLSLQQREKPPLRGKPKTRQQCLQQLNDWLGMEEPNRSISTKKDESHIRDRERHPSLIVLQTRSKPDPIRRWSAIVRDGSCFLRYEWKSGLDSGRGSCSTISTGPIERNDLRSSIQENSKKRETTCRLKVFFSLLAIATVSLEGLHQWAWRATSWWSNDMLRSDERRLVLNYVSEEYVLLESYFRQLDNHLKYIKLWDYICRIILKELMRLEVTPSCKTWHKVKIFMICQFSRLFNLRRNLTLHWVDRFKHVLELRFSLPPCLTVKEIC